MFISIFNTAKAYVKGGKKYPKIDGTVTFRDTKNGVILTAKINNLPQSKDKCKGKFFGFHIHEGTSCTGNSSDEFLNAKSHLNPTNCPHGFAYMSVLINKFKIKDILGKVIVIHDIPDDFTTQPSGNSGTKIACGKIEKLK